MQLCLVTLLSLSHTYNTSAFTIQNPNSRVLTPPQTSHCMVSDPLISSNAQKVVDNNNVEFTVGCTIQTCKQIKAYQVARKGYGSFDEETKSFLPLEYDNIDTVSRADRCLVLPQGIRASVSRVYDRNAYDAIMPVVAKFVAKQHLGGDYEPPITFFMHFEARDVEVVESSD
jgi:hypothetical protein